MPGDAQKVGRCVLHWPRRLGIWKAGVARKGGREKIRQEGETRVRDGVTERDIPRKTRRKRREKKQTGGRRGSQRESQRKKLNQRQRLTERMKGRGALKERGRKKGRLSSRKTPELQSVSGVKPRRSVRAQQAPAAGSWWEKVAPAASATKAQRVTSAPELSRVAEKAGQTAGGSRKFRASRSSLCTCSGGRARSECPGGLLAGSADAPAPPVRPRVLDSAPYTGCRTLRHPPGHPGHPERTRPRQLRGREGEQERDGDLLSWPRIPRRGNGSPHTGFSFRPAQLAPVCRAESAGCAEPALTWNPRRPANAARSPGSRPRLSLHTSPGAEQAGSGLGQPQRGALIAQRRARGLRERRKSGRRGR